MPLIEADCEMGMSDSASISGEIKVCTQCGLAQPIENFSVRNRAKGTRQAACKNCQNEYVRNHYQTYRLKYIKKARVRTIEQIRINNEFMIEYLSNHPCLDCGEQDIIVLEFDHLRDKIADVSVLARGGYSLEKLKQEVAKCEVVCANCHRRRTAKRAGTYRYRLGISLDN